MTQRSRPTLSPSSLLDGGRESPADVSPLVIDASSRSDLPPIVARHCTRPSLPTRLPVSDRVAAIRAVSAFPAFTLFGATNAATASLSGAALTACRERTRRSSSCPLFLCVWLSDGANVRRLRDPVNRSPSVQVHPANRGLFEHHQRLRRVSERANSYRPLTRLEPSARSSRASMSC